LFHGDRNARAVRERRDVEVATAKTHVHNKRRENLRFIVPFDFFAAFPVDERPT
jgi:hypothetical protein